ncbi:MAG: bifunctional D-glycero-beta-D-manno-heptose-7-phosphate kinase/D-glycero-beta-D-manno-heptose 1-phosphate adenylyltransferase HldE [Thermodesulfobacteriota bacterium]
MTIYCPDLSSCRVLVAGDVMLDVYYWGEVGRISPEAPVPVVNVTGKTYTLGGAGNVALNLAGLGCRVSLIGVRGDDPAGECVARLLEENNINDRVMKDDRHITTTKTRVIAQKQQLVRLDEERRWAASDRNEDRLIADFEERAAGSDVVILSDYGKGLFADGLTEVFISRCTAAGVPVFVDPKGSDWSRYERATCVTPNAAEFAAVCSVPVDDEGRFEEQAAEVIRKYHLEYLLVTRGGRGMSLFGRKMAPMHIATEAREVFDVSGAGDTVVSVVAAAYGCGLPMGDAAVLANCAAGIVVQKVGTVPVTTVELEAVIRGRHRAADGKIFSRAEAEKMIAVWRREGSRIVFTNGCFDLLHTGHVKLLHAAAKEGDRLIVGLNSDDSVRRLKGPSRPVLPEQERAALLAAIGCVDMVVLFSEDTPLELITAFKPDVLVKGGDYRPETVVGREVVEDYGGRVCLVPLKEGMSTTGIINAVKQENGG